MHTDAIFGHCVSGFVQLFIPVYILLYLIVLTKVFLLKGYEFSCSPRLMRSALAMTTCSLLIYCLRQTSL